MGDVLSQNEIDNLLSALNSGEFDPDEAGEADDRQIKDYDFARPSNFNAHRNNRCHLIWCNKLCKLRVCLNPLKHRLQHLNSMPWFH